MRACVRACVCVYVGERERGVQMEMEEYTSLHISFSHIGL